MSRIFHRAAVTVLGLALPLSAFAFVTPANVDKHYVDEAYAALVEDAVAEVAITTVELPGFGDEAVKPGVTNGCCQWVYYNGRWYCLPCP